MKSWNDQITLYFLHILKVVPTINMYGVDGWSLQSARTLLTICNK